MTENRLSPAFEFKLAGADASGTFTGYASTFGGTPDSYGDIIAPSAFTESLKQFALNDSAPALLWAHDPTEPIGKWLSLKQDAHGLAVTGKLTLGTKRGSDARALMQDGALALSIGYKVRPGGSTYEKSNRILTSVDLLEISAVSMPANPGAKITAVKSAYPRPLNIREFEAALRDACGFSVREAKRIASTGWPALTRRDDEADQEIAALLRAATKEFSL